HTTLFRSAAAGRLRGGGAAGDLLRLRPLPAGLRVPPGPAPGHPAGAVERPARSAVVLELHGEHQPRDEPLGGRRRARAGRRRGARAVRRDAARGGPGDRAPALRADGWVVHHNSDPWGYTEPVRGEPSWSTWPMGGLWLERELTSLAGFSGRSAEEIARERFPALREAVAFALCLLHESADGHLATFPSTSPE